MVPHVRDDDVSNVYLMLYPLKNCLIDVFLFINSFGDHSSLLCCFLDANFVDVVKF